MKIYKFLIKSLGLLFMSVFMIDNAFAAGYPVYDISNLKANLRELVQQVQMVKNQVQMATNQIKNMTNYDPSYSSNLISNLNNQVDNLNNLFNNLQGIDYQVNNIDSQYKSLFPSYSEWDNKSIDQYGNYYQQWSDQLHDATLSAMQSQSIINNVKTSNLEAQRILSQSQGADGDVRQLQSVNEMLANMSSQLGDLTTTLATSSRVTATAAAETQSTKDAQRENMKKFTEAPPISVNSGYRYGSNDF